MAKRIVWTEQARNDRREIFSYWNHRNKSKAFSRKLNQLFNETLLLVSTHPNIGKNTRYLDVQIKIVREYLIVYKVDEAYIYVISIWDGRQNPLNFEKILP